MSLLVISTLLRSILKLPAIAAAMLLFVLVPAQAEKRLALVIGNDNYENVTKLRKAANDATGIGKTLSALGFTVTTATNVPRREMNKTLQKFQNSIEEGDVVLFFFAGHGVEIDGENYLLPIDVPDATSDQLEFIKSETIRLNTVLDDLRGRKSRLNLVILDACRNNPFSGTAGRSLGEQKGLARISAPQGTFVMYSADVGETALDRLGDNDANPNSVFTRTLIPLMNTPGVDLVDTARQARRKVRKLALSVSHNQTPAYYDAVLGDFYFTAPIKAKLESNSDLIVRKTPPAKTLPLIKQVQPPIAKRVPKKPNIQLATREEPRTTSKPQRIVPSQTENLNIPALVVTAGEKDIIRLWDADRFQLLAELTGEKKLFSTIKLINKGRSLLVAGKDGSVVAYGLPSFKKTNAFYPNFTVSTLTQAVDGTIMIGGENGTLAAFDKDSFEILWRRQAHDDIVSPIIAQGNYVVSASGDGAIAVTDVQSGREISRTRTFAGGKITDIAFINENTVVASHEKGKIAYISLTSGRVLSVFKAHTGWISSVDITPDGTTIVTAGVNGNLKYWPIGGNSLIGSIPAHSDVASGAKYLKATTGNILASVGFDGVLRFWQTKSGRELATLKHGPAIVHFDYISKQ